MTKRKAPEDLIPIGGFNRYRGREISYGGAHRRPRRLWGKADLHPCAGCMQPAIEWAYDGADPEELTQELTRYGIKYRVTYSPFPEFYMPMCRVCHRAKDQVQFCKWGHPKTEENIYNSEDRRCKPCRRERDRRYLRERKANRADHSAVLPGLETSSCLG